MEPLKRFFSVLRDYLLGVDRLLLLECLLATACGLILISTAAAPFHTNTHVARQLTAACLGVFLFILATLMDMRWFDNLWILLYAANLLLQVLPFFIGDWEGGNRSWITVKGIRFQPDEVGKILFILSFAAHIHSLGSRLNRPLSLLQLVIHWGSIAACVVVFSHDDGQAILYILIGITMLFAAGLKYYWFLLGGVCIAGAAPLAWKYLMDDYQKLRILVTFDPSLDAAKAYQAVQTRKAIASGGLMGNGYLKGALTQSKLIPARHTDSIIAVAGEEFGAVGIAVVILLLTCIVLRCLSLAGKTVGRTDCSICTGFAAMLGFQIILNVGMNIGLLPVIGLTLPFISYGGTSLITMFGAMGIVAGIRLRT